MVVLSEPEQSTAAATRCHARKPVKHGSYSWPDEHAAKLNARLRTRSRSYAANHEPVKFTDVATTWCAHVADGHVTNWTDVWSYVRCVVTLVYLHLS